MWIEAGVLLALVVFLAYIAAQWDIHRMRKDAIKQAEQDRIVDVLKRPN
jgi:hypothetical protein